ncbi:uncharacterized protein LOC142325044 isoform X8 [Lycorma delicatula]|uniref:uncharacterized protein LOC142325044 isoform X8 n=1 Tax=Lycorma delicatula TaxID=130591 RepID=UPI003F51363D
MDSLHSFSVKPEIMPRRKSNLGRRTRRTEGSRRRLSNMTEEERASVRERNRLSTIHLRNVESAERRAARLEDARLRARQSRSAAKDLVRSQRNERLSKNTIPKKKKKRKNERSKKEKKRLYMQDKRKNLQGLVEKIYVKIEPQDLILDDYKDGDGDNNYDGMEDVGKEYDSEISTKDVVEKIYVKIEPQDLIYDDYKEDDKYDGMEEVANVNDGEISTKELVEKIYVKIEPQDLIHDDYEDDDNYNRMEEEANVNDGEITTKVGQYQNKFVFREIH